MFVYGVKSGSNFILSHVAAQFSQHQFSKRLCCPHGMVLERLLKTNRFIPNTSSLKVLSQPPFPPWCSHHVISDNPGWQLGVPLWRQSPPCPCPSLWATLPARTVPSHLRQCLPTEPRGGPRRSHTLSCKSPFNLG